MCVCVCVCVCVCARACVCVCILYIYIYVMFVRGRGGEKGQLRGYVRVKEGKRVSAECGWWTRGGEESHAVAFAVRFSLVHLLIR